MLSEVEEQILSDQGMVEWRKDTERGKQNYMETNPSHYDFVCHRFTGFGLEQFPGLRGENN